jgi:hypothetical protein
LNFPLVVLGGSLPDGMLVDIGVIVGLTPEAEVLATVDTLTDAIRLAGLVLEVDNAIALLTDDLFVLLIA